MGEGIENEAAIMPFISSANIACGFHAGDEYTIKKTIELALKNGVAVGAHPGYDDRANFGRVSQYLSLLDLAEIIAEQIHLFEKVASPMGCKIHHVKLHGAMYNDCAKEEAYSKIVAQTIYAINPDLFIYGLSGSHAIKEASKIGLPFAHEVFADRTYQSNGQLTPRNFDHALIQDPKIAAEQVLQLIQENSVNTNTGEAIHLAVDTICLHGDHPHAIDIAKTIYALLKNNQIEIKYP